MGVSYKKILKLPIDLDMPKTGLRLRAGNCSVLNAKLGKDENLTTAVLAKVCRAINCNIGDIMDILPDEDKDNAK